VQHVSNNSVHKFVGQKYKMHIKYLLPTCSTKLLLVINYRFNMFWPQFLAIFRQLASLAIYRTYVVT